MENYNPLYLVAWKSAVNNAMVVLVNCTQYGDYQQTSLYYLDTNVDETIISLYTSLAGAPLSDSVDGL